MCLRTPAARIRAYEEAHQPDLRCRPEGKCHDTDRSVHANRFQRRLSPQSEPLVRLARHPDQHAQH
jgi:hypothetical protein